MLALRICRIKICRIKTFDFEIYLGSVHVLHHTLGEGGGKEDRKGDVWRREIYGVDLEWLWRGYYVVKGK